MTRPKVLIVDDHRVVAEGLRRLLDDRFDIVDTVGDGGYVLEAVRRLAPDIVLLDLSMPNISGLEALRQLRAHGVACKAIVLTMHADANLAVGALKAGAAGYLPKESSGEELLTAIQVVLRGDTYLAASLTKEVVTLMVGAADPSHVQLTMQQREMLRLIVQGQRAKEIAAALDISTRTVDAVKSKMMQTLNVHSTAELVRYAVENHLLTL